MQDRSVVTNQPLSPEIGQVKVAPGLKSEMEAYKKTTRKRYEEHLATKHAEKNSEFNSPNIVCEKTIPNRDSNQTGLLAN